MAPAATAVASATDRRFFMSLLGVGMTAHTHFT
jgi:hypothetical protein